MTQKLNQTVPLDLIWGADAIAEVIGRSRRITYDMLDKGHLPAKQVGNRWVAERGKLVNFFLEDAKETTQ